MNQYYIQSYPDALHTKVIAIPSLADNYVYILTDDTKNAFIIDPGEAEPVIEVITELGLTPTYLLVTHSHHDHIDGVPKIQVEYPQIKKINFANVACDSESFVWNNRRLWMHKGVPQTYGTVEEIAAEYVADAYQRRGQLMSATFSRSGSGEIEIIGTRFLIAHDEPQEVFVTGEPMTIEMSYLAHKPISNPEFGLAIFRHDGAQVNGPNTHIPGVDLGIAEGGGVVRYEIEQLPLLPATYLVTTAVHHGRSHQCYDYHKQAYTFRVDSGGTEELDGLVVLQATWVSKAKESSQHNFALVSTINSLPERIKNYGTVYYET